MEPKAAELVSALKNSNLSIDAKISYLTGVKSDIKQKNVPEAAVPSIFEASRLSIASQHSSLLSAGFSTLGHLLKRLFIQEQDHLIALQGRILFPLLLERLGDHKERVRAQAAQAFTDLWPAATSDVEHYVLDVALVGKNPRAKEMSMIWLSNMTKNHGLLFRSYVPSLVACLEDADSAVRDTAKLSVVELFQNASARAKSDLRTELTEQNVRKSIVNAILTSIGVVSTETEPTSRPASRAASRAELRKRPQSSVSRPMRPVSQAAVRTEQSAVSKPVRPASQAAVRAEHAKQAEPVSQTTVMTEQSTASKPSRPISRAAVRAEHAAPSQKPDFVSQAAVMTDDSTSPVSEVDPLNVASSRDIDDMVRGMLPHFEGRETEENWINREKSVLTLRRLAHGNAPNSFSQPFVSAMKTLLDGIFKVVNSLRTTMSTNGCLLIQDLALKCGGKIDSMLEIIMQNLLKLSANMKKIAAQNGNRTVDIVIANVSYTPRILQHVGNASLDKNVQLRLYSAAWFQTIIKRQAHHKSSIEHGGGLDIIEKGLKKGLSDANPGVREAMRGTFWCFFRVWPERANAIISTLDTKSRMLLEKDPGNITSGTTTAVPEKKPVPGRSALKEAIAARKKAYMGPAAGPAPSKEAPVAPPATAPTIPHTSSLSAAPMRPGVKPRRIESAATTTFAIFGDQAPAEPAKLSKTPSIPMSPTASTTPTVPTVPSTPTTPTVPTVPSTPTGPSTPIAAGTPTTPTEPMPTTPEAGKSVSPASSTIHHQITVLEPRGATVLEPSTPTTRTNENTSPSPRTKMLSKIPVYHGLSPKHHALEELSKNGLAHQDNKPNVPSQMRLPPLHIERTRRMSGAGAAADDAARRRRKILDAAQKKSEPRRCLSPRSKDSTKGPAMLEKGIQRIRSKSMDILGYRKIQGLIEYHDSSLEDSEHLREELLAALLDELVSTPDETCQSTSHSLDQGQPTSRSLGKCQPTSRSLDLKTQVLQTVRFMLGRTDARHAPRVLLAILQASHFYEPSAHIFTEISATAEYIITCDLSEGVVEAVVGFLSGSEDGGHRATQMGLNILTQALREIFLRQYCLSERLMASIGALAARYLTASEPDTRRQVTQMCVPLHALAGSEDRFWGLVGWPGENTRNLLTYYIARQ
ncbi:hypothetical protein BO71DRAFT_416180 [Aspergillus ellipticus CBS 707.79]|uniref:TOG domain-containing protein n=1 Tax=Aspergillus ellipticus CBS 707.79 TaxID=1448320 RepID=A0A319DWG8_9EURO|nr:hypothetical protein BO71DRAFT_416180 [Aspergillus ellipticus CBS 707.79]